MEHFISLTRRAKRSLRCLLAEWTWQINKQNCKLISGFQLKWGLLRKWKIEGRCYLLKHLGNHCGRGKWPLN